MLKSGSYKLVLNDGHSRAIVKKHGSEIYPCPQELVPYKLLDFSDKAFSEIDKRIVKNPYKIAGIKDFKPARLWSAPAASSNIQSSDFVSFPTVRELDEEIDSWPESVNPFKLDDSPQILDKSEALNLASEVLQDRDA